MIAPVAVLVLIVVALGLVLFWVLRWAKERGATAEALEDLDTETLEYVVPPGQDPVVVTSALAAEGFTTSLDSTGEVVLIHCPTGRERARPKARAAIAAADTSAVEHGQALQLGRVTFRDES
jgi:hypothetical protein